MAWTQVEAQSFHGLGSSRYGGVHNVIYNPGLIHSQHNKFSVNVISVYSTLGSDYSTINFKDGIGIREGFQYNKSDRTPKDDNQFFKNVDLLGPSVMYRHDDPHSFGISTRIRGVFNVNNLNGLLLENVDRGFDEDIDFTASSENFSGTLNVWTEIGFTYGFQTTAFDFDLQVGATLKYLQGIGGVYTFSPQIDASYEAARNIFTTAGTLVYGTTIEFEEKRIDFSSLAGGFAVDIGIVLDNNNSDLFPGRPLRAGISLHDLGSIQYNNTLTSTYNIDKVGLTASFDNDLDIRQKLNQRYEGTTDQDPKRLILPRTMHLFADFGVTEQLYFGIESSISLIGRNKPLSNRIPNYFTINPRMEKKWISLFMPLSIQQHTGISWGAGCRVGVLFLGSESILSNLISPTRVNDVFVGVFVPIYK